ncbi:hypothetical protein EDD15DRAFT_2285301 [Pisolithus albus]|nr:hypothetical protein EDD15DRAFT_2285301 [Pisolithus albus]
MLTVSKCVENVQATQLRLWAWTAIPYFLLILILLRAHRRSSSGSQSVFLPYEPALVHLSVKSFSHRRCATYIDFRVVVSTLYFDRNLLLSRVQR